MRLNYIAIAFCIPLYSPHQLSLLTILQSAALHLVMSLVLLSYLCA